MKEVSKFLALILRHRPDAGGLTLDPEGWAPVEDVLAAVRRRHGASFGRAELEQLVHTNDKKRYAFDESGTRIRASQGHSVAVDLKLEPVPPPRLLYHGSVSRFLDSILGEGLRPGQRRHVHLSSDVETAAKVGSRRSGGLVILEIASGTLAAEGHAFYKSANGVWLTDAVPARYLRVVEAPVTSCPPGR